MDEKKLIALIQNDPSFINKLAKFDDHVKLAEFLRNNGIDCADSEASKILCALKYFQSDEKSSKISDDDLNVTGGVSGVSNKLLDCFVSAVDSLKSEFNS